MATAKRGKTTPIAPPATDEDDDEPGGAGDGATDDLDALLEELSGEVEYVVLWRTDGTNGRQEHVDKVPLSRFNAEYVRERHGGGDFVMRAYGAKLAGGRRSVKKYREFSIDRSVPPKTGSAALAWKTANPGAAPAPAAGSNGNDGPAPWLRDLLTATVPVVVGALVAYATKDKPTDPVLLKLLEMNGGSRDGVNPVELQRLLADERDRAIALGEKIGRGGKRERGEGGHGDDTTGLLTEGVRAIGTLAEGWRAKAEAEAEAAKIRAQRGGGAVPETAGALPAASTEHVPSEGAEMPATDRPWIATARPFAGSLMVMAGRVAPPTAAAMIGDVLDDDAFTDLVTDIADETAPGFVGRLRVAFPPLQRVPDQWLLELVASILEQVAPDEESEPATAPGADKPETKGNGPTE